MAASDPCFHLVAWQRNSGLPHFCRWFVGAGLQPGWALDGNALRPLQLAVSKKVAARARTVKRPEPRRCNAEGPNDAKRLFGLPQLRSDRKEWGNKPNHRQPWEEENRENGREQPEHGGEWRLESQRLHGETIGAQFHAFNAEAP